MTKNQKTALIRTLSPFFFVALFIVYSTGILSLSAIYDSKLPMWVGLMLPMFGLICWALRILYLNELDGLNDLDRRTNRAFYERKRKK